MKNRNNWIVGKEVMHSYVLMNKTKPLFSFLMDDTGRYVDKILDVFEVEALPVGIHIFNGIPDKSEINKWWQRRTIPAGRKGLQGALQELEISSQYELAQKSFGLSLSDQYWINPEGKLKWENINFFENKFSDYVGNVLYGQSSIETERDLLSPCNTSEGNLVKKWMWRDGEQLLVKGGSVFFQEPYNEALASALHRRLGLFPYVDYSVEIENNMPCSICENFVTKHTELVPAYSFLDIEKKPNNISYYQHLLHLGMQEKIERMQEYLDYMLVTDYIIANTDRHYYNFGFIRNVDSLSWEEIAPIYDSGNSLYYDKSDARINVTEDVPSMPFKKYHSEQIKMVSSFDNIDFSKLTGLDEEFREILRPSIDIGEQRKGILCQCLKERISMAEAEQTREKSAVFISRDACENIFQEAGFRPTDTLISNMQKLNIALGRETTLREIKELRKNKEQLPGKAKYYVEAIAKECAAQEMVIQERSLDIEP